MFTSPIRFFREAQGDFGKASPPSGYTCEASIYLPPSYILGTEMQQALTKAIEQTIREKMPVLGLNAVSVHINKLK